MNKVASHILGGFSGDSVNQTVKDLILKHHILGFVLYSRNFESAEQLISLNEELHALGEEAGYQLLIAVDQEGGRVARLPAPFSKIPPMRELGLAYEASLDETDALSIGVCLGKEVKAAGFDLNFAPLIDVDLNEKNPIIGDRSFSKDPCVVTKLAEQIVHGLNQEGVLSCLKHFPGHGMTHKDSHLELPIDERGLDDLKKVDLVPYVELIQKNLAQSIMTAHVMYPNIDPDYPATLSKTIIHDLLRKEMGYEGLIFSDDMLMKAIYDNHDLLWATQRFFEVGGDVVLVCDKEELIMDLICQLNKKELNLKDSKKRIQKFKKLV